MGGRANLGVAVTFHLCAGLIWLGVWSTAVGAYFGVAWGLVWFASGAVLWIGAVGWMSEARDEPATVWARSFYWWCASFLGPLSVAGAFWQRRQVNRQILLRLEGLERRLASVEAALEEVRSAPARVAEPEAPPERREPAVAPAAPAMPPAPDTPVPPVAAPAPARAQAPARVARPPEPPAPRRELDWSALFGPKALAVTGGVVTVLGIVFFFALAVNRGWVGPGMRVALGSAASLLVFGAGLEMRRRYGRGLHASLAAVGAGIAGGYATLLAATALYDLVPEAVALPIAAGIAALALVVSLAWRSELVAGIGLIGAMVAPALLVFDTGLTATGTAFVALVFASAAAVAVALRWRHLLFGAAIVAVPQALVLFADRGRPDAELLVLSAIYCLIALAAGIAWQLRGRPETLDGTASAFVVGSAGLAFYSAFALFHWSRPLGRGIDLLVFAVAYGVLGAYFLARRGGRDLGSALAALALALAAVGVADVLSGGSLTYVWAAEAAALAWLAGRMRELRFQVAALAYAGLALAHTLAFEAPVSRLFEASERPASGAPSLLAVAAALAVIALCTGEWRETRLGGVLAHFNGVFDALRSHQRGLRIVAAGLAGVLTIEAASLALLEAYTRWWSDDLSAAFDHGQVALTGAWAAAAVVAIAVGLHRRGSALAYAGLAWLAVTLAKTILYDAGNLDAALRSWAFLEVAGGLLLAAVLIQALRPRLWGDQIVAYFTVCVSLALTVVGLGTLLDGRLWGIDKTGAAFLGVALLYGAIAAGFLRQPEHRNFSTLVWTLAVSLAAFADSLLVGGQWLVVVWAAGGATLALLTRLTSERRFQLAALAYLGLATALALTVHATFVDLFSASASPGSGVPSLLVLVLAIVASSLLCTVPSAPPRDAVDAALDRLQPRWRVQGLWIAAGLAVYGLSLAILEVAERVGPRDVTTNFQSGHTAVSAVWGALGLALLYVGLRRRDTALRLGGVAIFGVSLAKLFLYDLSRLSSITRAVSFLAVGAVLMLGGFFYQRLGSRVEEGAQPPERPVLP